jgi:uncharacterized repeat protein (TIGR01451 family)
MSSTRPLLRTTVIIGVLFLVLAAAGVSTANAQSQVDFSVLKSGPATAAPNATITYQIVIGNSGPDSADATMLDNLPADLSFVSLVAPDGWSCDIPSAGMTGLIKCVNPNLPVIQNVSFTIVTNISPSFAQGSFVTNKAAVSTSAIAVTVVGTYSISITSGNAQTTPINNSFSLPLQVTITVNGSPKSGANVTFQAPSTGPSLTFAVPVVSPLGTADYSAIRSH